MGPEGFALAVADGATDDERLERVFDGLCAKADAGEITAAGYCADMDVTLPEYPGVEHAILICVEDGGPTSTKCLVPYHCKRPGDLTCEEPLVEDGEPQILRPE